MEGNRDTEDQGSKLVDLTGEKITLFDLGSCGENIEDNDLDDLQLQHGSIPRPNNPQPNVTIPGSGFEGFAANIDLNNVRHSQLNGPQTSSNIQDNVRSNRQANHAYNNNRRHAEEQSIKLSAVNMVFDRSGNTSRQH